MSLSNLANLNSQLGDYEEAIRFGLEALSIRKKVFGEEHPDSRRMVVSLDKFNRRIGDIECVYVLDFFKMLWSGGI